MEDGRVRDEALGSGSVTRRELFTLLRQAGVRDTGEVERAWLEPSGDLSLFRYSARKAKKGETTLPENVS
ncbi:MAG: YetF domain-containing protein [Rhizobiaceae bacterium]